MDAVKEHVVVPWVPAAKTDPLEASISPLKPIITHSEGISPKSASDPDSSVPPTAAETHARILSSKHFETALKEITPSSSEALGSLADLRKWNEEFGEGRKDKKRRQVWGKDRFGFTDQTTKLREEGRVVSLGAPICKSDTTAVGE